MTHLEHEMQQLKAEIIDMSKLVSQQMKDSLLSLAKMDKQLALETLTTEKQVNAMELKIDKTCESIFALHNPVAQDLRLVLAQLRINYNLEKIGDIAASVAKFVKNSFDYNYTSLIQQTHALHMFEEANDLLVDVMNSFENEDAALAKNILERDKALNQQNDQARAYIIEQIKKDPENVEEYLKVLSLIRKLERAGDQSKAIAKEIIFFVEAKIVKHSKQNKAQP